MSNSRIRKQSGHFVTVKKDQHVKDYVAISRGFQPTDGHTISSTLRVTRKEAHAIMHALANYFLKNRPQKAWIEEK